MTEEAVEVSKHHNHHGHNDLNKRHRKSHGIPADLSHFWVVTMISNSPRYERRYRLYHRFERMCMAAGVKLITVEVATGQRDFMVTHAHNPRHVQLRTFEELWHKENALNLGAQRAAQLDSRIDKIAFIDADLRPMSEPRIWFEETWHALQHYEAVQMFEYFIDLDTDQNPLSGPRLSFMGSYIKGGRHIPTAQPGAKEDPNAYQPGKFWLGPPGGAWAWNIGAFNQVGGLMDFCILGSADWHMAQGLLGFLEPLKAERWSPAYSQKLYNWQDRALRWVKKDVGMVRGGLMHDNHGPKKYRYYVDRKKILVEQNFNPCLDLKYDHQGLLQLETWDDRQIKLRDDVRAYFHSRLEDMPEYRQ